MITMHCPHGCVSPCSNCEASAAARELRQLRALRTAVRNLEARVRVVGSSVVELERESWFELRRALSATLEVSS